MRRKRTVPTNIESGLARRAELRRLLEARRSELVATLQERMRGVRTERRTVAFRGGLDDGEMSEVDTQEDIELALIQMRAETISLVDESIARLEAGVYGQCSSCGEEIATSRLRALPFAVRCRECEEQDEAGRGRTQADQARWHPLFGARTDL